MFEKLEEEGTPVADYSVKLVDEIDLADAEKVDGLRGDDGIELSDLVVEGPRECQQIYADDGNLYWTGTIIRNSLSERDGRGVWYDLGRSLDHISTVVSNHNQFDQLEDEILFQILVGDYTIQILSILER